MFLPGGGGESKLCSHNLQSDQQGSWRRICLLIMRINGLEKKQNHGGRRRDFLTVIFW